MGKFGLGVQNEAGQRLTEFCQENALVIANTLFQQHKRRIYTWTSPGGQYWNEIDYILCSQGWRSSIQSAKTRLGADCGSDHELHIDKFRLKLKDIGKTTRPFRYDLNQITYDYTVKETNRFRGLDLIDRVPKEYTQRFVTLYRKQWSRPSQEKEMQIGNMVVWGGLTNTWEKKRSKRQRRKGKIYPFEWEFRRIERRDKKAFLSNQCKEIEENNRTGKSRDLFNKIRDTKGTFHATMGKIKDKMVWT